MSERHADRLDLQRVQLLVVDIQEKLLPKIANCESVLAQAERMVKAAVALDMPITVSEQYPRGLGSTAPAIAAAAGGAQRCEKMTFSFCADGACRERLVSLLRPQVLLVGIETHVCVQQTALDLLDLGMSPTVLADAVGSRRALDWQIALDRMRSAGVTVTTVEAAIFELVHVAQGEKFKAILPIVR
jgi:nicotinamidase-related amidase